MSGRLTNPGSRQPIDLDDPGQQITLLHDEWQSYKAERLPLALNEAQVEVLQQAFYAGARGLLNAVDRAFAEGLPGEECGKVLPAVAVEIDRFLQSRAARHN